MRRLQTPESGFFHKVTTKAKRNKLKTLTAVAIVVGVAILILVISSALSPENKLSHKLANLDKPNTTCQQVRNEIGDTEASKYSMDLQKDLLERQMLCFADALQFDKAIVVAQKLKVIYGAEGDSANKARVEARITDMKDTQATLKTTNKISNND